MRVGALYFFQRFDTVGYRISIQYIEKNSASVAFLQKQTLIMLMAICWLNLGQSVAH